MRVIVSRHRRSGGGKPRLSVLLLATLLLCGSAAAIYTVFRGDGGSDAVSTTTTSAMDATAVSAALGALESFGARSAEEAAEIWAEGVSAKNGLTQYAVMTDALKERYLEIVGNSGGFLFPTSAARIDAWRITEVTDEADGSVSATLEFDIGGNGSVTTASAELTIESLGEFASVSSVAVEEPLYEFTGIG